MAPQTATALALLVAFVLPGFITVLIQERTFLTAEDLTPLDRLLRAVYYGVWSYLLLAIVALLAGIDREYVTDTYHHYEDDPAELVWRAALVILLPSLAIATATRWWSASALRAAVLGKLGINARHLQPTAWDHFFRQRRAAYVRVSLKDGARIFGFYGSHSFAAYAKDGGDLYLERVYVPVADWFGDEVEGNRGVWIPTRDVVSVELYDPHHEQPEAADSAAETAEGSTRGAPAS